MSDDTPVERPPVIDLVRQADLARLYHDELAGSRPGI
jgi:hypothetical protein